jgi:hypothetical protein
VASGYIDTIAPSGRVVRVNPGAEVSGISSRILFRGDLWRGMFQIGGPSYHAVACESFIPSELLWRDHLFGRELVCSVAEDKSVTLVAWLGQHHELMTILCAVPQREKIYATFAMMAILDRPQGLTVQPADELRTTRVWEDVTVVARDRGTIHIPDPQSATAMVPLSRGAKTMHGEVWRTLHTDEPPSGASADAEPASEFSYVVGCPRGAARVSLSGIEKADDDVAMDWITQIDVAWL